MRILLCSGILLLLTLAVHAELPATPAAATVAAGSTQPLDFNSEAQYLPLLDKTHVDGELIELVQDGSSFRGIYCKDASGKPKGALLILNRHQGEPGWNTLRSTLQTTLADHGWTSLAITLPPQTTDSKILQGRIQIAQAYLVQQGQMNIALLCYRTDCVGASHYIADTAQGSSQPPQAWIMLDAEDDNTTQDIPKTTTPQTTATEKTTTEKAKSNTPAFLKAISKTAFPVLDLITSPRYHDAQQVRQRYVREQKWQAWQMVELPETPPGNVSGSLRTVSRIGGWLDKTTKGRSLNAPSGS